MGRRDDRGPRPAQELGICIIYQELSLVDTLSVGENIFLGDLRDRGRGWEVDWPQVWRRTSGVLGARRPARVGRRRWCAT